MKKVSVIIPVYNSEPFIRQCVESVQNQTFDSRSEERRVGKEC